MPKLAWKRRGSSLFLRIADYHTYFVGAADWGFSVWAHNQYDPHNAAQYEQYKRQLAAEENANPGDPMRRKVVFNDPEAGTTLEGQNQIREAVAYGNLVEQNGFLSPTGRVSTTGVCVLMQARQRQRSEKRL